MTSLLRRDIKELFYITPLVNVPSIMKLGILSHTDILRRNVPHDIWHMEEVQQVREEVLIPISGKPLHTYVNFYLNCRNAAMYARKERHESLCVLSIDSAICDDVGVLISPTNAAKINATFFSFEDGLQEIVVEHLFTALWILEDGSINTNIKSRMMAEVLVPKSVQPFFIKRIYVCSASAQQSLSAIAPDVATKIRGDLFFKAPYQSPIRSKQVVSSPSESSVKEGDDCFPF